MHLCRVCFYFVSISSDRNQDSYICHYAFLPSLRFNEQCCYGHMSLCISIALPSSESVIEARPTALKVKVSEPVYQGLRQVDSMHISKGK